MRAGAEDVVVVVVVAEDVTTCLMCSPSYGGGVAITVPDTAIVGNGSLCLPNMPLVSFIAAVTIWQCASQAARMCGTSFSVIVSSGILREKASTKIFDKSVSSDEHTVWNSIVFHLAHILGRFSILSAVFVEISR